MCCYDSALRHPVGFVNTDVNVVFCYTVPPTDKRRDDSLLSVSVWKQMAELSFFSVYVNCV